MEGVEPTWTTPGDEGAAGIGGGVRLCFLSVESTGSGLRQSLLDINKGDGPTRCVV